MINNWKEINSRYDAIKNHKPRASKKLKELGEILASAYILDPQKADEMWQYIIELNIEDNITFSKFYIVQVFNNIMGFLTPKEAAEFISMRPERVRLMFMYGYDGIKNLKKDVAYNIIGNHIFKGRIDDAVETLSMFEEMITSQEEVSKYTAYDFFNFLFGLLEDKSEYAYYSFRYNIPSNSLLLFYDSCRNQFKDKYIQAIVLARTSMLNNDEIQDKEKVINILHCFINDSIYSENHYKKDFSISKLFIDFLYFERNVINVEDIFFDYCNNAKSLDDFILFDYYSYKKYRDQFKWYHNFLSGSERILHLIFEKVSCRDFLKKILLKYMYNSDWKFFLQLIVLGLNQETEYGPKSYLEFIKDEIRDYFYVKDKEVKSEDGKWWIIFNEDEYKTERTIITKPRLTKTNINDFIQTLGRACLLTSNSNINGQLIDVVSSFVTKETGNVDALNAIGIEVKANKKSELDRFCEYAEKENLQRTAYDSSYHSQENEFIKNINKELRIYGVELGKLLAKQPQILSFLFLHSADSFRIKGDIILGALLDDNDAAALRCVDYMIETASYPNFSDPNSWSWANEMSETVKGLLEQVIWNNESKFKESYSEKITSTIIQITEKCLQYLDGDDVKEIKAELLKLKPTDNDQEEFIRQLMKDAEDYIAVKKHKGYNPFGNITNGIEIMFKLNRIDVIAQILRKFIDNKCIAYSTHEFLGYWLSDIQEATNKQYLELYSLIPDVYASYIELSKQKQMALIILKEFGNFGNLSVYKALKNQVIQKYGYIDGINSCFIYSEETANPFTICNNKLFEVKFLYFNVNWNFGPNWSIDCYSIEVAFKVKNKIKSKKNEHSWNKKYICLLASDIFVNGVPLSELQSYNKYSLELDKVISWLESEEKGTGSLSIYLDNEKRKSFSDISEISFSISAQIDDKNVAKEGPFTIIRDPNNETFMLKR